MVKPKSKIDEKTKEKSKRKERKSKDKSKAKNKQKQKQMQTLSVNVNGGKGGGSSGSGRPVVVHSSSSASPMYIPSQSYPPYPYQSTNRDSSSSTIRMNVETQTPDIKSIRTQTPITTKYEIETQTEPSAEIFTQPRKTRSDKGISRSRLPTRVDSSAEFEPVYNSNGEFTLSEKQSKLKMDDLKTSGQSKSIFTDSIPRAPIRTIGENGNIIKEFKGTNSKHSEVPSAKSSDSKFKSSIKTIGSDSNVINQIHIPTTGETVNVEDTKRSDIPVSVISEPNKASIRTISNNTGITHLRNPVEKSNNVEFINSVGSSRPPELKTSSKISELTQSGIRTISTNKSTFTPLPTELNSQRGNRMTLDDLEISPIPASTPERNFRRERGQVLPGRFPVTDSNQLNFS